MSDVESAAAPALACHLLALDTATERTSLAVVTPQQVLTLDADGGSQASARLLPELQRLLERASCRLEDLDAIAFGCGPGAFTGLRTACSVAQGLALGAGKPVLPIDSLKLVAETVRDAMLDRGASGVWVVQDARMDEIYAAHYRWRDDDEPPRWQTVVEPALYSVDGLHRAWDGAAWRDRRRAGSVVLAGSALSVMGERIDGGAAPRLQAPAGGARARALARLAVAALQDGVFFDAGWALPLYLRDKVAQTTAERERAAARREPA